jgi:ATP-binding cassette, subfamily B, bacterial
VLDDATSAIDAQVEELIHLALRHAMKDRTTIIIGHRVSTIRLAERVAVIDGGRIVATGTHLELLANEPLYAEILAAVVEPEARELLADARDQHEFGMEELVDLETEGQPRW